MLALSCGTWALSSWHMDSLLVVHGLSCSEACGTLVSRPGTEPEFLALRGRFPTTRPPGKSQQIIIEYPQWLGLRDLVPCSRCKAT